MIKGDRKPTSLKIATVAMRCEADVNVNVASMVEIIDRIAGAEDGVDLIFFGEMITSRYQMEAAYLAEVAFTMDDARLERFRVLARKYRTMICFGFTENAEGKLYNSQILIGRRGETLGMHRKHNLTRSENKLLGQGPGSLSVFEVEGIRIGVSICYDSFDSEHGKCLKAQKPHLMLHSLADPMDPLFTTGYNGRITNALYVSANRVGREGKTAFTGHIAMVGSGGKILELKSGREQYILREIAVDLTEGRMRDIRKSISNKILLSGHLLRHVKHVINYLKWDAKMKKGK